MMSYFILNLDTTSPELEIYTPVYTGNKNIVEVNIESDEILDDWQEVFTVDEKGIRRDYTFSVDGNRMTGTINPYNYPVGLFHLYVKARDKVYNETKLYEKVITIKGTNRAISLDVRDFQQIDLNIRNRSRKIDVRTLVLDADYDDKG